MEFLHSPCKLHETIIDLRQTTGREKYNYETYACSKGYWLSAWKNQNHKLSEMKGGDKVEYKSERKKKKLNWLALAVMCYLVFWQVNEQTKTSGMGSVCDLMFC